MDTFTAKKDILCNGKEFPMNKLLSNIEGEILNEELQRIAWTRESGALSGHGIYLCSSYNWRIVSDGECLVLLPTKKPLDWN